VSMPLVYCCDAVDELQQQRQEPPQLFSDPQQAVKDIVSAYTAEQGFKEISVEVGLAEHVTAHKSLPSIDSH